MRMTRELIILALSEGNSRIPRYRTVNAIESDVKYERRKELLFINGVY